MGNKYSTSFNKLIIIIVTAGFFLLYGITGFKGKSFNQINIRPNFSNYESLLRSSFILFAYNGSVNSSNVEEFKDKDDIPKGIVSSISFATLIYAGVAISVIALIGIKCIYKYLSYI